MSSYLRIHFYAVTVCYRSMATVKTDAKYKTLPNILIGTNPTILKLLTKKGNQMLLLQKTKPR